jgi:hypothetical protein
MRWRQSGTAANLLRALLMVVRGTGFLNASSHSVEGVIVRQRA